LALYEQYDGYGYWAAVEKSSRVHWLVLL